MPATFQQHLQNKNNYSFNANAVTPQGFTKTAYMNEGNEMITDRSNQQQQNFSFPSCYYCSGGLNSWQGQNDGQTNWKCATCDVYYGKGAQPTLRISEQLCTYGCNKKLAIAKSKKGEDFYTCSFCQKANKDAGFQGMCSAGAPDDKKAKAKIAIEEQKQLLTAIHNEIANMNQFIQWKYQQKNAAAANQQQQ